MTIADSTNMTANTAEFQPSALPVEIKAAQTKEE
jgi:hypothetical protein